MVDMARRKKGGRTPSSAVSNGVNKELPKDRTVKGPGVKGFEDIYDPRISLEDKKKFLVEQQELLKQYSREYTSSWQEYMKVKSEESTKKKDKAGQAHYRQQLIIREILYQLAQCRSLNCAGTSSELFSKGPNEKII